VLRLHLNAWKPLAALFAAGLAVWIFGSGIWNRAGVYSVRSTLAQELPPTRRSVQVDDHGVFEIFLAGRPIGSETFKIRSSPANVEAEAEIRLQVEQHGKRLVVQSSTHLTLDPQLCPITYSWNQKGQSSSGLQVDFSARPARVRYLTVSGATDDREFEFPPDVMVLDDNVLHHYELIAIRSQELGGGKQTMHVFVPQEALPSTLTVEDLGNAANPPGGAAANLRHLLITTDVTHIDLWIDAQQHIERLSVPQVQLEAVRKR
jgi:hypothetical protein